MRAREFVKENATVSGNIAVVAVPMGEVIQRMQYTKTNKYKNSAPKLTRTGNARR